MSSYTVIIEQMTIYVGSFCLISGVLGGLLNLIIFLSLKTFREKSCSYYLIIMSLVNIGELLFGQLSRILITGYSIDWTIQSVFYCKFRVFILQLCALISMFCICFSIIDQYLSTSSNIKFRQLSNIRIASRIIIIIIIISTIYNIPFLIYYDHIKSSTGKISCTYTNYIFQQYSNYVSSLVLARILPLFIMFLFSLLSYINIHKISHRRLPIDRQEFDKQITKMVLLQVFFSFFIISPYVVIYFVSMIPILSNNPSSVSQLQFASSISSIIYYLYYSSSFYIYFCASKRFRRQLKYVLFDVYLHKIQQNHIAPIAT